MKPASTSRNDLGARAAGPRWVVGGGNASAGASAPPACVGNGTRPCHTLTGTIGAPTRGVVTDDGRKRTLPLLRSFRFLLPSLRTAARADAPVDKLDTADHHVSRAEG
jgi:hypothetical protein